MWLSNLIQTLQKALQELLKLSGGGGTDPKPPEPPKPPHNPVGRTYSLGDITDFYSSPYQLECPCTIQFNALTPVWLSWTPSVDSLKKQGVMTLKVDGMEFSNGIHGTTKGQVSLGVGHHTVSFIPDPALPPVYLWLVMRGA